ncbi:MAG: trypsin-like peptidase domain-containing protein [Candidatus Izemoplasmatales bacterium]|nr:trypsin-like peptidase domain-containing protein [Candidatus Izemoplasmatales bacterium]
MKRIAIFLVAVLFSLALAGCNFDFTTSAVSTPYTTTTTSTSTTSSTTTSTQIDISQIEAEIYQRLYSDLYDQVYAQVVGNISQEEFDTIYAQVVQDSWAKIDTGEIEVTAATVTDMILSVVDNQAKSVIGVSVYAADGTTLQAIGSGVIYKHLDNTYYVVTNNHVVADGEVYMIRFEDGTEVPATLRGVDPLVDLAVLYFTSTEDLPVATFGDSDAVEKGTIVLAVGNPSGYDYFGSVTYGIVSGTDRYFDIDSDGTKDMFVGYIQHDASINAGNSGGALFNLQGEVIGINVIKIADIAIEGMGFAIPSSLVEDICSDIEQYGVSKQKPVLGIEFVDISNPDIISYLFTNYKVTIPSSITSGFYVMNVVSGSSFDGYVEVGDIVTQIGDITITDTTDFVENYSKYRVGDLIDLVLIRNGVTLTFTNIELKPKPEA